LRCAQEKFERKELEPLRTFFGVALADAPEVHAIEGECSAA
jgi:hypothetical protein